jgi:HEAT repeat protein
MNWALGGLVVLGCLVWVVPARVGAQPDSPALSQSEDLSVLLQTLRKNVGLSGNIVQSLAVQKQLAVLGKRNPHAVVPTLVTELTTSRATGRQTIDYQLALISVLEAIGPAAEAAVPILTAIVQDPTERNDSLLLKTRMALSAVGTPSAEEVGKAADKRTVDQWRQKASPAEVQQTVLQQAYFIRSELRRARMSEQVIETAVSTLRSLGPQATVAVPTLLQAWADPRVGTSLRTLLTQTLTAAGVTDVEATATHYRQQQKTAPSSFDAISADIHSENDLVSTLAMTELGEYGPSEAAVAALIQALREQRHPDHAALILGQFGVAAKRAIPALLPYLTDPRAGANAIQALSKVGAGEEQVVTALRKVVADERSPHRALAASALESLHSPQALPELRQALSASDKYTRILAMQSIGSLAGAAAVAIPEIAALLEDPDMDVRASAVEALGRIGPAAAVAVPRLEPQLQSSDERLKERTVTALEQIGGKEAQALLARDARRYAEADIREYQRLRQARGLDVGSHFIPSLPRARRVALARELLKDADSAVVSTGASFLIQEGFEDETVPRLADLVLNLPSLRTLDRRPLGRRDDFSELLSRPMRARICDYLNARVKTYSLQEQERIRMKICP